MLAETLGLTNKHIESTQERILVWLTILESYLSVMTKTGLIPSKSHISNKKPRFTKPNTKTKKHNV